MLFVASCADAWLSAQPPPRAARVVTCSAEKPGPSWRRIAARSGVFTAAAISVGAAPFLGEGQRQLGLVQAADASALKHFGDYALDDKIASIPCFMITNSGGSPYLKTTNEGNQQVIIFMDIRDAEAHLGEMLQASPMLNDAQILAVGMDKAWSLLRRSPHATGQPNPKTGQEQIMTYKLMPARGEFGKAMRAFRPGTQWKCSRIGRVLQHMKKLEQMESSVCCFLARGMTVTKVRARALSASRSRPRSHSPPYTRTLAIASTASRLRRFSSPSPTSTRRMRT